MVTPGFLVGLRYCGWRLQPPPLNLLVIAVLFTASRPNWRFWGEKHAQAAGPWLTTAAANEGCGAFLWGAFAILWWLLLENDLFDTHAHCDAFKPWMLLREPLLATAGHGLASFAVALHRGTTR